MVKGFGYCPFDKWLLPEILSFCFICKTISKNTFYTKKMDYKNFMTYEKTSVLISQCMKLYAKYKLRKFYNVPKFHHNKEMKQAMKILW